MSISRRDFMKFLGVSVASLLLTRCKKTLSPVTTCYGVALSDTPTPSPTPSPAAPASARLRLRQCWSSFDELAQQAIRKSQPTDTTDPFGRQLIAEHRAALDELVAAGEIAAPVADLVQEAYEAAVNHVWDSNIGLTCYTAVIVNYTPVSASILVQQAETLSQIASQGSLEAETLARVQTSLEHDLAFYDLAPQDVQALYNQIIKDYMDNGQPVPPFEELQFELTPDARAAARFILDLLTEK